jgi:CRISPR system Cascade subunit CasB
MEQQSSEYRIIKDEMTRNAIKQWWEGLESNKGGRARLRRCREPKQVFLHSSFYELNNALPQWPERQSLSLAAIAGLAANVDQFARGVSFPQQLGRPKEPGANPPMSETRFRQLIKSRDWPEFYVRMRRAIIMLKRNVDVLSLAEYIRLFGMQQAGHSMEPSKSFQFRMAQEYFNKSLQNANKPK